ncbi:MAG: preprotein translocase SecE subunit [Planctomycetota bacterium]|jgi:preprotein translocase SecE subunit
MAYRSEQGRHARMFAFWSLALLCLFGASWLHSILSGYDSLMNNIKDWRIPIVGIDITGAFLISLGLLVVLVFVLNRYLERPKVADTLIDTEGELKKVTWPTLEDVINSSIVVIISVVILGFFLAGTDWVLHSLVDRLLYGGSA